MNKTEIPVKTTLLLKLLDLGNTIKQLDINYKPVNKKATKQYMSNVRDICMSIVTFIDEISGTVEDTSSTTSLIEHELHSVILGQSLFAILKENEDIVVHNDDHTYVVAKLFDKEEEQVQMKITINDDMLKLPHLQMLTIHDEVFGTA